MSKKPHPVDLRDAEIIRNAVAYQINVFLGRGRYARVEATSYEDAIQQAEALQNEHARRAMIYGVNAEGRAALLTPAMEAEMAAKKKTTTPKKTAGKILGEVIAKAAKKPPAKAAAVAAAPVQRDTAPPPLADGAEPPANAERKRWEAATFTDNELVVILAVMTRVKPGRTLPKDIKDRVIAVALRKGVTVSDAREILRRAHAPSPKPANAPKRAEAPAKSPRADAAAKAIGKRAQIEADARAGKLPSPPDFSAATHDRYRAKLAELVKLAKAGDIAALKRFEIKTTSSSPKAMDRYRNLAVMALEAQKKRA